jgi:replicative DNA helicase
VQIEMTIELFDELAERSLLGALMGNPHALGENALEREEFYFARHQHTFDALQSLVDKNVSVDLISINAELKNNGYLKEVGGASWVAALFCEVPSWQAAKHHATIVKEFARKRALEKLGKTILLKLETQTPSAELIEHIEKTLKAAEAAEAKSEWFSVNECIHTSLDEIDKAMKGEEVSGLTTGLRDLDRKIGGLRPGNLVVIAGRPSMGKSALGFLLALSIAKRGSTVGILSLEMSKEELVKRQLAMESEGVTVMGLERGKIAQSAWAAIVTTSALVAKLKMWVCDSASMTVRQLCRKARALQRTQGLDFLVVDYLQLIDTGAKFENRVSAMSDVSRNLKMLARELKIPIVALSQVNRDCEKRQDKRPLLGDLRETGAIEQDADFVIFVYRDEFYDEDSQDKGTAELLVRKNRHGPTGDVRTKWDGPRATFRDLTR